VNGLADLGGAMRGDDSKQEAMFSYVSAERRVPQDHPLRPVREMVDTILKEMWGRFARLYSTVGRPSIAPERLLRALLLQIFYSVRSERLLMEQLDYNLLFRWFVGMEMDEAVWNHAVFSKNRERLLNEEVAQEFFARVLGQARSYLSDEHFTVDGTLIEAWASQKSFRAKDSEPPSNTPGTPGTPREADFHGQRRGNETHQSTSDPEARLYKKSTGSEAKLSYLGHGLMENRNGLLVRTMVTQADGTAEREAAMLMAWQTVQKMPATRRITLAGDKNYDTREFVATVREMGITPHVARNEKRPGGSAIDARTTQHSGYAVSQRKRKLVEQAFGWMKTIGQLKKVKLRGLEKVSGWFTFVGAAYNLMRLRKLRTAAAA